MKKIKDVVYFQVAISNPKEQLDLIIEKIKEGWKIVSAVHCLNVIQYILVYES